MPITTRIYANICQNICQIYPQNICRIYPQNIWQMYANICQIYAKYAKVMTLILLLEKPLCILQRAWGRWWCLFRGGVFGDEWVETCDQIETERYWLQLVKGPIFSWGWFSYTPYNSQVAPENRPSQKETSIPTINLQVRTVGFSAGNPAKTPVENSKEGRSWDLKKIGMHRKIWPKLVWKIEGLGSLNNFKLDSWWACYIGLRVTIIPR